MSNINEKIYSLNTHIAFLKNDIEKLKDTALELENKIKEMEAKKEQLIKERNESKYKITRGENYYFVDFNTRGYNLAVTSDVYVDALGDRARVDQNNCFRTKERAEEVLNKIKLLLKLERLHDIYRPDYKPDWSSSENKYLILYSHTTNRYVVGNAVCIEPSLPCFPTNEIAQKVCEVLNEKERGDV